MLILTRKKDQQIVLEIPGRSPVVVTVTKVAGNTVKLGISADDKVNVRRGEVKSDRVTLVK